MLHWQPHNHWSTSTYIPSLLSELPLTLLKETSEQILASEDQTDILQIGWFPECSPGTESALIEMSHIANINQPLHGYLKQILIINITNTVLANVKWGYLTDLFHTIVQTSIKAIRPQLWPISMNAISTCCGIL